MFSDKQQLLGKQQLLAQLLHCTRFSKSQVILSWGMLEPDKPDVRACFSPSGHLVKSVSSTKPFTVEIHDGFGPEYHGVFAGPLVRLDAQDYKIFYQCKKWLSRSENIIVKDESSLTLIGDFLEYYIKQNGVIVRKEVIDLILKGYEPGNIRQEDTTNNIFRQGQKDIDKPFAVERSIIPLEKVKENFRRLLMYGWKKDALYWAVDCGLWGHAFHLAQFMDKQTQEYVSKRFNSAEFEMNDVIQRFYQLLHANPPAKDEALDWAVKNNLWGHACDLGSTTGSKNIFVRFANLMKANDPLQTFYQLMSGSVPDVSTKLGQDGENEWRPHLAMILSNNNQKIIQSIITLGDSLESEGKTHACTFCYLMVEMFFGSSDKYRICLSASSNVSVLKLIHGLGREYMEHTYSLELVNAVRRMTRHQEHIAGMQVNQNNQNRTRLLSREDNPELLHKQLELYLINKEIDSPEILKICNYICNQIRTGNTNILDVQAYYYYDDTRFNIMYGILPSREDVRFDLKHVKLSCFILRLKKEPVTRFVPYREVKRFPYENRQQKTDLIHCLEEHHYELFRNHSNLKRISASPFKEVRGEFMHDACVALHVSKKGLIPVGQGNLPKELMSPKSGKNFSVDVRFSNYNLSCVYRADDYFKNLRMGCKVYSPISDSAFTLGGFVFGADNSSIFFITCAHSFLSEETVEEMIKNGKGVHVAGIESGEVCFQPDSSSKSHCGVLSKAVFKTGNVSEPGVDCALVQCCFDRLPVCGYFPDSPGDVIVSQLSYINNRMQLHNPHLKYEFTNGEMLSPDQIPENSKLCKFGITTGWTEGSLVSTGSSVLKFKGSEFEVCLHSQLKVEGINNMPFALEGDSGSWVFVKGKDYRLKLIGMVTGFEGYITTVTPISPILNSLGLQNESLMHFHDNGFEEQIWLEEYFADDEQNTSQPDSSPPVKFHYEDDGKDRHVIPDPDRFNH